MITNFKIFESNKKIGKEPYFIFLREFGKSKTFSLIYDMRKDPNLNTNLFEYVDFTYNDNNEYSYVRIFDTYENSYFEIKNLERTQFMTPNEFFTKYENACFLLYDRLDEWLKTHKKLNDRYMKLFNTLKDIEELKIYINSKIYNI